MITLRLSLCTFRSNCKTQTVLTSISIYICRYFVTSFSCDVTIFIRVVSFKSMTAFVYSFILGINFFTYEKQLSPKSKEQGRALPVYCLKSLCSGCLKLVLRLLFGKKNEFSFFGSLLMTFPSFSKIFNI